VNDTAGPRAQTPPRFRESAAVILVRGRGAGTEVYWVLRSEVVPFMPGFRAFPGGGVAKDDLEVPLAGASDDRERALKACLIREALEETGVLLGATTAPDPLAVARAQRDLLSGSARFPAIAREFGWTFRADALTTAGRWMTPPFATARFDTTFFLARVPEGQEPRIEPGELESGEWITPERAIDVWLRGLAIFAAPILITLRDLAEAAAEDREVMTDEIAARLRTGPERAGQPVRRIELSYGIVLQPMQTRPLPPATHTNTYVVGEQATAIIDPGSGDPGELESLFGLLDQLAASGRKPQCIVVTHAHPDHFQGVTSVRERFGTPVLAHADTATALASARIDVERTLADGDLVELGAGKNHPHWNLRVIHTPGHARGHLCLFHEPTGSLFTGDHIVGGGGTVIIDPPEGDMAAYLASLERLLLEPVRAMYPGHGSPQGGVLRRIQSLIAHRLERERKVLEALDREPRPLPALVERAYAETPRELWVYAERSLLAHLIKLEAEGRARRHGEAWSST
jgi:endoribonuclease LACTB2